MTSSPEFILDKSAVSIIDLTDDRPDKSFWLAQTPADRIRQIHYLRQLNYGDRASARLQRVLDTAELKTG